MPIEFYVNFEELPVQETNVNQNLYIDKFEWKTEYAQHFTDAIGSDYCKQEIDFAMNLIDVDINRA